MIAICEIRSDHRVKSIFPMETMSKTSLCLSRYEISTTSATKVCFKHPFSSILQGKFCVRCFRCSTNSKALTRARENLDVDDCVWQITVHPRPLFLQQNNMICRAGGVIDHMSLLSKIVIKLMLMASSSSHVWLVHKTADDRAEKFMQITSLYS